MSSFTISNDIPSRAQPHACDVLPFEKEPARLDDFRRGNDQEEAS